MESYPFYQSPLWHPYCTSSFGPRHFFPCASVCQCICVCVCSLCWHAFIRSHECVCVPLLAWEIKQRKCLFTELHSTVPRVPLGHPELHCSVEECVRGSRQFSSKCPQPFISPFISVGFHDLVSFPSALLLNLTRFKCGLEKFTTLYDEITHIQHRSVVWTLEWESVTQPVTSALLMHSVYSLLNNSF